MADHPGDLADPRPAGPAHHHGLAQGPGRAHRTVQGGQAGRAIGVGELGVGEARRWARWELAARVSPAARRSGPQGCPWSDRGHAATSGRVRGRPPRAHPAPQVPSRPARSPGSPPGRWDRPARRAHRSRGAPRWRMPGACVRRLADPPHGGGARAGPRPGQWPPEMEPAGRPRRCCGEYPRAAQRWRPTLLMTWPACPSPAMPSRSRRPSPPDRCPRCRCCRRGASTRCRTTRSPTTRCGHRFRNHHPRSSWPRPWRRTRQCGCGGGACCRWVTPCGGRWGRPRCRSWRPGATALVGRVWSASSTWRV